MLRRRKGGQEERTAAGVPVFRHQAEGRRGGPPGGSSPGWREALAAHYEQHLGPCPDVFHELMSEVVPIDLHPHVPSWDRPHWTIVTTGVSDRPTAAPSGVEDHRRIELLTYLPATWPVESWGPKGGEAAWWPARMLKQIGRFVHEHRTWLGPGHTIALGGARHEAFVRGSLLTSVVLSTPYLEPAAFSQLSIGGTPCRFLWVFPITEGEERLILEEGVEAFHDLRVAHQLKPEIDPARPCMVTGRRPHV